MTEVWEQYRAVEAGNVRLEAPGLDLDVNVWKPRDDPLEFEVRVWNLAEDTWNRIDKDDDLVRIELGWADGEVDTVVLGKITHSDIQPDGGDVEFFLKGMDESEVATHHRLSDKWRNRRPDQIVSDIADEIGLTPRVRTVNRQISGAYSISRDQKVRAWLDELLDYAAQFTGDEWEWYALEGALHFEPRNQVTVQAPQLAYQKTLVSIGEKSSTDEDAEQELEFEALLDPRIRTGAVVWVETDRYEGAYRVSDYEFKSSTVTGDHLVRGTLVPVEGDFRRHRQSYEDARQYAERLRTI